MQYQMGTVVEVTSVRDPDREGRYNLAEKSKVALHCDSSIVANFPIGAGFLKKL